MKLKNNIEVLSPVGSEEMLVAAVRSGADAVYFGAKEFSARRNADNFDDDSLKEAVAYCHIRGVKAYLALNIMLKENELVRALSVAENAANAGIDGLIIQDLGLARLIHNIFPSIPLHASTQMSVHSVSALPILKEMGFCQVVAAREMSFEDLTALCTAAKKLDMTVEVFVHGALCMCLSGQCLLSSFLGSRSGNRGLCAGPCRLPFSVKGGTGNDLSLKDLSLLKYVSELVKIGVNSLKIEGRMKRPEYVAAATAAYRQAVDNGFANPALCETLKNVFSRSGFTDGYFKNKLGKDMFGIRTKEDVAASSSEFSTLHELYRSERQNIGLSVYAEILRGKKISLTLSDGVRSVTSYGDLPTDALNKSADKESITKNILKFGSTPYYCEEIKINLDDGLFVKGAELNELRRAACRMLDEGRAEVKPVVKKEFVSTVADKVHEFKPHTLVRFESVIQIPEALSGIDGIILPLEAEIGSELPAGIKLIVDVPRGIINENTISKRLKLFKEKGFNTALCGNIAAVEIARKAGFEIFADTGMNIYNSQSVEAVSEIGATAAVLSNEILLSDALEIKSAISKGIVAYGSIPLMIFKNCPLKNGISCDKCDKNGTITDRKGIEFRVRCRMGYSEMLNSVPIWLADRSSELKGLDFIILYFTKESAERVNSVISAYKKGLPPDNKHTRGLFYRGTI